MLETILFGIVIMLQYLVSGSSATPMMGAALAVVSLGSAALALLVMGRRPRARELGLRALVMLALGGMLYGLVGADNKIAASRAGRIAFACEEYKDRTGAYPASLRDLVPDYLDRVPAARRTIMWAQFRLVDGKVMYVREPGMLAAAYDLKSKGWRIVDAAQMFPKTN